MRGCTAAAYEFWANSPQSLHQVTILMADRGIPASLRNMHGFSSHTFSFRNKQGRRFWFKWHFKTNQGIKNPTNEEAAKMAPNGAHRETRGAANTVFLSFADSRRVFRRTRDH